MIEEHKGYKIEIEQDMDNESPREWDCNYGRMICFHSRYSLGDKHNYKHDDYTSEDELMEAILTGEKSSIYLPLFLYDHGNITMSTGSFECKWDSGQVGVIVADLETIKKEQGWKTITKARREEILKWLEGEVRTYDTFIRGDVHHFNITDPQGEELDSCGGMYGYDETLKECEAIVDGEISERSKPVVVCV